MILILLTFLMIIYIKFGILCLIQIIICMMVFLSSNYLIGINPFSRELYIIRILAICAIIYLLYYNSITYSILSATILPLSIKNISYIDDLRSTKYIVSKSKEEKYLTLNNINIEIFKLIKKLDINDNYIIIMEFIPEKRYQEIGASNILLSKPFLINKFSSNTTILNFIFERLDYMSLFYLFDDNIILETKNRNGPIIQLKYAKISF